MLTCPQNIFQRLASFIQTQESEILALMRIGYLLPICDFTSVLFCVKGLSYGDKERRDEGE